MRGGRFGRAALAAFCVLFGVAAGPPEIQRVHAPARKATSFFPKGSELRVLSVGEFEQLVKDARNGAELPEEPRTPRLLKAEHRARLDGDLLTGETDLTFETPAKSPALVEIRPWTPALLPAEGTSRIVNSDDGRFFIPLDAGSTNPVRIAWTLRARTGSGGTIFSLGLPRVEISSLRLDLPAGMIPEGSGGIRQGPVASERKGRQFWRFDGAPGLMDLRLRNSGRIESRSRNWIGGDTTIELGESVANWRGEWTMDLGVGSERRLFLDLDPGLELLDVEGPAIVGFRTEPLGERSRLTMQLSEDAPASSPITLRAIARLPDVGTWSVPTMRPLEAVWTGGRTSVRVGKSRTIEACKARGGIPVDASAEEKTARSPDELWLDFETTGPRSVADLTLRYPREQAVSKVLSRLRVGRDEMELDAEITWTVERGRLLVASAELPGGWTVERVASLTKDVTISWLVEPVSGGGSRLVARPSEAIETGKELALRVVATGKPPALGSWLELPRPRTPGAIAGDERALLLTDSATNVRSVDARGMVWLDPDAIDLSEKAILAWRWTRPEARGRVSFDPRAIPTSASVRERVTIDPQRLRFSVQIQLKLAEGVLRRLRVLGDAPPETALQWRLEDDPQGPPLPVRRLEVDGGTAGPTVWEVELPYPKRGSVELTATGEYPWDGRGVIPRIHFEPEYPTSGRIQIDVERTMRTTLHADGVRVIEDARVEPNIGTVLEPITDQRHRPAHRLAYEGAAGRIELATENLSPVPCDGLIREARLNSRFLAAGGVLHGMDLHIIMTGTRELGFRMPEGLSLQQVGVDGRPSSPFVEGDQVKVPLAASSSTRSGCVVHLEFAQGAQPVYGKAFRPIVPEFSLPVLSMVWQVQDNGGARVRSTGLLLPMSLNPDRADANSPAVFGPSWAAITGGDRPLPRPDPRADFKNLKTLAGMDLTFGELLTRLDAGRRPIIIDRIALADRGITPATLLPTPISRLASTAGPLREFGLLTVAADGAWIVTSVRDGADAEAVSSRKAGRTPVPRSRIDAILAHGSDPSDRYRTVARWCAVQENLADSADAAPSDDLTPASRYATIGREVTKARAEFGSMAIPHGLAWGIGLVLFGFGIGARRWNVRVRLVLSVLILVGIVAGIPPSWIHRNDIFTGTLWGAIGCLGYWNAGRSGRRAQPPSASSVRSTSDSKRAVGAAIGILLIAGFTCCWLATRTASAAVEQGTPILAVFAEEPGAQPEATRVVLLLADDARLRALADRSKPATAPPASVLSNAVEHRVRTRGDGTAELESRFRLTPDLRASGSWSFPLGSAREVRAVLNGREVPVLIQPGGEIGRVLVPPGDPAELILSRNLAREVREESDTLSLAVTPGASAIVRVESRPGEPVPAVPSARGGTTILGDGSRRVDLGPANRLEVLWNKSAPGERPRPKGSADALLLWDAQPAGDLVRVRLTLNNLRDPSRIRLGLDPGWVVLSTSIPGLIDTGLQGSRERPEWIARTDPPLPEGATIRFEIWRPREFTTTGVGDTSRPLPRVEPLDVAAFIGRLGFRRPEGWRGRLRASAGSDPLTDEEFLSLWGTLPDNRASLAGAIRYALTPKIAVDAAPIPVRVLLTPDVRLQLQPGRVLVDAAFQAETRGGVTRQVEFIPPEGLVVERVDAPGLSDWSLPSPDRLVVRFDREARERFTIRVGGSIPLNDDGTAANSLTHELAVPLFKLPGSERLSGVLTVDGPATSRIQLREKPDAGAGTEGGLLGNARGSLTAALNPNDPDAVLSWSDEAGRVRVLVRAVLTMNVNSADWLARLSYRSSGGAIDRVAFQLPTSWSKNAAVVIPGVEFRREQKVDGETTLWTLMLARPVWGELTVRINGTQTLPPEERISFPDLVPLGKGQVDTYLAFANSTVHPLFAEGSSKVQEIDPARMGTIPGLPDGLMPLKAFHVLKEGWSLRAKLGFQSGTGDAIQDPVRVSSADLCCVVDPDGTLLGAAHYVLESDANAFLPVILPAKAEALAAQVDRMPVRPLVGKNGVLLIPLGERRPRRVSLVWKDRANRNHPGEIELPALRQPKVPTLVRLYLPERHSATGTDSRLQRVSVPDREIQLLERLHREITQELVPTMDRGDLGDQAELLASLVDFELQSRAAERAANRGNTNSAIGLANRRRAEEQIATARKALAASLHLAGLDPYLQSAQARVGGAANDPLPEIPRLVDRASILGIPRLGLPWDFSGDGSRPSVLCKLRIQRVAEPSQGVVEIGKFRSVSGLLAFLCLGLIVPSLVDGPIRLLRLFGALMILGLATPLGPSATLVLVAVLGISRFARPRA
jgi:hypothetical protein